jgi:hypothetical protein
MKTSKNGAPILTGNALQKIKEQVEKEFAKARTIERRRFGRPAPTDPSLYGRRKDDKPLVVDAVVERFKQVIADAADPEVELVAESEPLAKQAAALLASIEAVPVFCKKDVECHEINEVFQGDVKELFAEAEAALGLRPKQTLKDRSDFIDQEQKPSIWTRDVLGRRQ